MSGTAIDLSKSRHEGDFALRVSFPEEKVSPSDVLLYLSKVARAFETLDRELVKCIASVELESSLVIYDIQSESIGAWFRHLLHIKEPAPGTEVNISAISEFLSAIKKTLIQFRSEEGEDAAFGKQEKQRLKAELFDDYARHRGNFSDSPIVTNPPRVITGFNCLRDIQKASRSLPESVSPSVKFPINDEEEEEIPIDFNINFTSEESKAGIAEEVVINRTTEILMIRYGVFDEKSTAQWEFVRNGKGVKMKIADEDWLERFRERQFGINCGDSIRAKVKTETFYGENMVEESVSYEIERVVEIIRQRPDNSFQGELDLDSDPN